MHNGTKIKVLVNDPSLSNPIAADAYSTAKRAMLPGEMHLRQLLMNAAAPLMLPSGGAERAVGPVQLR